MWLQVRGSPAALGRTVILLLRLVGKEGRALRERGEPKDDMVGWGYWELVGWGRHAGASD